ncbi:MAG TPA: type IV-A pilus assembly ATPase PilB [Candidatus Mcinerneyibacteriales bacterium]|nr:type IV-A pilus assembly ATPase PilB [Candidatus Mcinerneyibacteriales bacterium]HPJ70456.1 type IV-A pilus assembly ATPase PilB [Candidatus Mcinerneyibacteriales bacterium]
MSKIGSMLRAVGLIDDAQLQRALEEQKRTHETIGTILVKLGFVSETDLTNTLGKQLGVASVDLSHFEIDANVLRIIPEDIARKYKVIPLHRMGYTITLAMANPTNVMAIDDIKFRTGYNIEPVVAAETSIMKSIDAYYGTNSTEMTDISDALDENMDLTEFEVIEEEDDVSEQELLSQVEDEPVVKLVQQLIAKAVMDRASDIHIEPYEKTVRVRFRVDGTLQTVLEPPKKLQNAIISRIKILSKLDIAERRLPQDGRSKFKVSKNKVVDLRVSTLPTVFGEKVVMRILDKENLRLDMTKLGFEKDDEEKFKKAISAPYGMVLVTGPTGSGKTTTLYSALSSLNQVDVNIMTAEDPVEFNLKGINQVNVHSEIGLTFAASLRSFLRQDPDIILVGEIRDFETAEIAIKAALTGHLVLSTLHTNDAPSTVNRMINMGVEPFLIASSTVLVLAQRLMRTLCPACKEEYRPTDAELVSLGITREEAASIKFYQKRGCPSCNNSGYKGRVAIYEVMPMSENLRRVVLERGSVLDIKEVARREGLRTLRESAVLKFKQGITSFEEIIRTTFED